MPGVYLLDAYVPSGYVESYHLVNNRLRPFVLPARSMNVPVTVPTTNVFRLPARQRHLSVSNWPFTATSTTWCPPSSCSTMPEVDPVCRRGVPDDANVDRSQERDRDAYARCPAPTPTRSTLGDLATVTYDKSTFTTTGRGIIGISTPGCRRPGQPRSGLRVLGADFVRYYS